MFVDTLGTRSKLLKAILTLLLTLVAVLSQKANAETTAEMDLSPERCVALNEGQTCYQTVTINWKSDTRADYCLTRDKTSKTLMCWHNAIKGTAKIEFASRESVTYYLHLTKQNDQPSGRVAKASVIVTWVYSDNKRRPNSWRLF